MRSSSARWRSTPTSSARSPTSCRSRQHERPAVLCGGVGRCRGAARCDGEQDRALAAGRVRRPVAARRARRGAVRRTPAQPSRRAARRAAQLEAPAREAADEDERAANAGLRGADVGARLASGGRRRYRTSGRSSTSISASALLGAAPFGEPLGHPLLLVCTHGKRDRCCARYGPPLCTSAARGQPRRLGVAVEPRRRRPLRGQRRLPAGRPLLRPRRVPARPRRVLDEYLAGRIDLERYRGRSATRFRCRRPSGRCARPPAYGLGSATRAGAGTTGWRSISVADVSGGRMHEVEVALGARPEEFLTCTARRPKRARRSGRPVSRHRRAAGIPREPAAGRARAGWRRRARRVARAARTVPRLHERLQLLAALLGKHDRLALERSRRPLEVGDHRRPPLERRVGVRASSAPQLRRAGRRGSAAGVLTKRSRHRRRTTSSASSRAASRSSSSSPPPVLRDRARGTRRLPRSSFERRAERFEPRDDVDADREVQGVGLGGERLVQPAAREVERVAGARARASSTVSPGSPSGSNSAGR